MNVYALGATDDGAVGEVHQSVLRARSAEIWPPDSLMFHGAENAVFNPEKCDAVVMAGGDLPETPADVEHVLRYPRAMRWFSDATIGISLGVVSGFRSQPGRRQSKPVDSLKMLSVRDAESARILRQSGVRNPVLTCADLGYLRTVTPRVAGKCAIRPVLGIVAGIVDERLATVIAGMNSDFEIRHVSSSNFSGVDVCLTTQLQGAILSVLHQIPFAAVPVPGETLERECRALDYPLLSDVREAWAERDALRTLLEKAKPSRLHLAQRNIELLQAFTADASKAPARVKNVSQVGNGKETLVVWAAPDEYWDEAEDLLTGIGPGFDCLVPAQSRFVPSRARRRIAIPAGALMHWGMFPEDLKQQIEKRYDTAIVCHAFRGSKHHLSDIAAKAGRSGPGWEFRLWTHSCESYS